MRFLTVRDLRTKSADIWRSLSREKEMVVTSNGRPVAILSSVAEDDVEGALFAIRQARAVQAVAALQRESSSRGTDAITGEEIEAEIRAVREKRRR